MRRYRCQRYRGHRHNFVSAQALFSSVSEPRLGVLTVRSVFAACVVVGIAMAPQAPGEEGNGVIYTDTQSNWVIMAYDP
jgi:hypothetical protein